MLLADLSGYTAYLAASEPERAPAMAADLVETVVRQLRPTFRLEKLEGDAAFMVAPLEGLTGEALLAAIDATTAAFQARLRSMAQATTCTCEACRRIPELDLKFVVHVGSVVRQRVAGRMELAGTDVIVAHRLLKAESPATFGLVRYALLTDAVVASFGLDPARLASGPGSNGSTSWGTSRCICWTWQLVSSPISPRGRPRGAGRCSRPSCRCRSVRWCSGRS